MSCCVRVFTAQALESCNRLLYLKRSEVNIKGPVQRFCNLNIQTIFDLFEVILAAQKKKKKKRVTQTLRYDRYPKFNLNLRLYIKNVLKRSGSFSNHEKWASFNRCRWLKYVNRAVWRLTVFLNVLIFATPVQREMESIKKGQLLKWNDTPPALKLKSWCCATELAAFTVCKTISHPLQLLSWPSLENI